jgi:hypothetical protein
MGGCCGERSPVGSSRCGREVALLEICPRIAVGMELESGSKEERKGRP